MQGGLAEAATPFLNGKRWQGGPHQFVTWRRRTHFENSMTEGVEWLVAEIEKLRPFPEVVDALGRLKSRYGLAILSNGDRDMPSNAAPYVGFEFDATIIAEILNDISDLLLAYDIRYLDEQVVGDAALASPVASGQQTAMSYPYWLRVIGDSLSDAHAVTASLNEVLFAEPGSPERLPGRRGERWLSTGQAHRHVCTFGIGAGGSRYKLAI